MIVKPSNSVPAVCSSCKPFVDFPATITDNDGVPA